MYWEKIPKRMLFTLVHTIHCTKLSRDSLTTANPAANMDEKFTNSGVSILGSSDLSLNISFYGCGACSNWYYESPEFRGCNHEFFK